MELPGRQFSVGLSCLVNRGTHSSCFRLSFQGYLYSKQHRETDSSPGAKARLFTIQCDKVSASPWSEGQVVLLPFIKGSLSSGFVSCNATPCLHIPYLAVICSLVRTRVWGMSGNAASLKAVIVVSNKLSFVSDPRVLCIYAVSS